MVCPKCEGGREVCMYCRGCSFPDWVLVCNCGLYEYGFHLRSCAIVRGS